MLSAVASLDGPLSPLPKAGRFSRSSIGETQVSTIDTNGEPRLEPPPFASRLQHYSRHDDVATPRRCAADRRAPRHRPEGEIRQPRIQAGLHFREGQPFVSRYETGERQLDVAELDVICQALNTTLADVITDRQERCRD